jgi:hypothetical protein
VDRVRDRASREECDAIGRANQTLGRIREEGKMLRVILLADGETLHNAFFDRSFKEDEK